MYVANVCCVFCVNDFHGNDCMLLNVELLWTNS